MKFLDKIFLNKEEDCFRYRLVLDIGTEYLKAALVEYNREERNIIAFSRVKQDYGNMVGGHYQYCWSSGKGQGSIIKD